MLFIVAAFTGSSKVNQAIQDNFTAAVNCWNFLHSNMTYSKGNYNIRIEYTSIYWLLQYIFVLELNRLCQQWNTADWPWFNSFTADVAAYKVMIWLIRHGSHWLDQFNDI